ncbi:hypothetical protein, partial [Gordonia amicalis]|uniref:hypothetical protein n=1 Tax=Gordonia amicalis TaxID=89053 RepID=UPI0024BAF317
DAAALVDPAAGVADAHAGVHLAGHAPARQPPGAKADGRLAPPIDATCTLLLLPVLNAPQDIPDDDREPLPR